MKNLKKLLIVLLIALLASSTFIISASAYTESASLLDVDINLEVGTYSGSVFTPLAPGTAEVARAEMVQAGAWGARPEGTPAFPQVRCNHRRPG